jgi:hypothetical protein
MNKVRYFKYFISYTAYQGRMSGNCHIKTKYKLKRAITTSTIPWLEKQLGHKNLMITSIFEL